MNGLPVTAMAAGLAAMAASIASDSEASPPGPNVEGLVWSSPLSMVISATGPSRPGTVTSRRCAFVTSSSVKTSAGLVVVVLIVTYRRSSWGSPR